MASPIGGARRMARKPVSALDEAGDKALFFAHAVSGMPRAIRCYAREIVRLLAEVSFGSGALAVIGGTLGVMVGMTAFVGTVVGMQGFSALQQIGTAPLTGFLTAYFNTREVAPLAAGLTLSATVGCGFTAQLGAMRISDEVDALEAMAVRSLPFLVSTRIIAGFVAVIPLYTIGLLSSYLASRVVTVYAYGQSAGTYDHYFSLFLPPEDVLYSFGKVLLFSVVIILVHCYFGYRASGGPAGVGTAVGRAVRMAITTLTVLDFFLSLAIWGATTTVRISG